MNSSSTSDSGTPASANAWRSLREEVGPVDLARADVEREAAVEAARGASCRAIAATSPITQSPISAMSAGPLGDRDEGRRQPQAVARVVPAKQRLGAGDLAGDQAHLRLEGEHELAALDGFGQRLFGVDLLLVLGGELGVEQAMLAAAARLGAVHGDVGGAHQRFDARAVIGRDRDADRGADVDAVRAKLERLGDRKHDPARDPLDLGDRLDLAGRTS